MESPIADDMIGLQCELSNFEVHAHYKHCCLNISCTILDSGLTIYLPSRLPPQAPPQAWHRHISLRNFRAHLNSVVWETKIALQLA